MCRRHFFIADFRGERAGEILFVPKSLSGYFAAGGTPRQGAAAYAQNGIGTAGAEIGDHRLQLYGNHGQGTTFNGPLEVAPTVTASYGMGGNNQPFIIGDTQNRVEILNDQGGDSLCVETGGVSPTLRSQTHGNLPITVYAIQSPMAGRLDGNGPQGSGVNENVSFTLNTIDRHAVAAPMCLATGQANAEVMEERAPTLVAGHEQPILARPHIAGSRERTALTPSAGRQNGVMKAYVVGAYRSGGMLSDNPEAGIYETRTARTLDLNGGSPCCNQGGVAVVEGKERQEAQAAGFCVRRLTPTEAERLQGYPDGWTEYGGDGKPVCDTKRYQMLGNSVAVPCVAYIMQGIRDAEGGA